MSDRSMQKYLANHPRMIGVLFSMVLLLSQAGSAVAGGTSATAGP